MAVSGEILHQLPKGRIESFDDQEVKHASDIADQAKYRFSIPEGLVGPGSVNLGAITGNTERPDGELDERGLAGFRALGDGRWAFVVAVQYPGEHDVREVLLVTSDGIYGNEPFKGPINPPALLRAPGGQCELHAQGDGNCVYYDVRPTTVHPDGTVGKWVPLATFKDGRIREFREDGRYDLT